MNRFDIIFDKATVYDGTGRMSYTADVGLLGGRIAEIGQLEDAGAKKRIDARNKVLCPGFIDVHSHADMAAHFPNHHEVLEPLLRQGITTFVGGNCGMGLAPFSQKYKKQGLTYMSLFIGKDQTPVVRWDTVGGLLETLETQGMVMNCAFLAPHGMIRLAAMGMANRPADHGDMQIMRRLVAESLDAGAMGLSTGLQYFPGLASDEDELANLAALVKERDGVFTSHLRSYSNTLGQAIDELMSISRRTGVRAQLSHLFWVPHVNLTVDRAAASVLRAGAAIYKRVQIPVPLDLAMRDKLQNMGKAIKEGLPLGIDCMPTGAGFTHVFAFFPPWALEGDKEAVISRLTDPQTRQKMYRSITQGRSEWPHRAPDSWSMNFFQIMGFKSVHLMGVVTDQNKKYEGMDFVKIGKLRGQHPFDAICDMLLEEDGNVLVYETPTWPGDEFAERSVYASIADPNTSIATDTILLGHGKPSHLFYDCYPKLFAKYVRREKRLCLEEAIRKSTSLPAQQLGLRNRGLVRRGYWADLVLFDAQEVETLSTPQKPDVFPVGVEYVLVNGHPVVTPDGYFPKPRKGMVIRRGDN